VSEKKGYYLLGGLRPTKRKSIYDRRGKRAYGVGEKGGPNEGQQEGRKAVRRGLFFGWGAGKGKKDHEAVREEKRKGHIPEGGCRGSNLHREKKN